MGQKVIVLLQEFDLEVKKSIILDAYPTEEICYFESIENLLKSSELKNCKFVLEVDVANKEHVEFLDQYRANKFVNVELFFYSEIAEKGRKLCELTAEVMNKIDKLMEQLKLLVAEDIPNEFLNLPEITIIDEKDIRIGSVVESSLFLSSKEPLDLGTRNFKIVLKLQGSVKDIHSQGELVEAEQFDSDMGGSYYYEFKVNEATSELLVDYYQHLNKLNEEIEKWFEWKSE